MKSFIANINFRRAISKSIINIPVLYLLLLITEKFLGQKVLNNYAFWPMVFGLALGNIIYEMAISLKLIKDNYE